MNCQVDVLPLAAGGAALALRDRREVSPIGLQTVAGPVYCIKHQHRCGDTHTNIRRLLAVSPRRTGGDPRAPFQHPHRGRLCPMGQALHPVSWKAASRRGGRILDASRGSMGGWRRRRRTRHSMLWSFCIATFWRVLSVSAPASYGPSGRHACR